MMTDFHFWANYVISSAILLVHTDHFIFGRHKDKGRRCDKCKYR